MGLEAATLATISAVATGASAVVSTIGAYQQSQAAKAQAEYKAAVSRNNQIIAQQNADAIRERGQVEEADHRRRIQQTIGSARAAAAGNGFLIDGSAEDTNALLQASIAEAGELDILRLRDDVELRAREQVLRGQQFGAEAALAQFEADQQSPFLAAGATLLEGAAATAGAFGKIPSSSSGSGYRNPLAGTATGRRYGLNSPSGF
jgi:hypothetical protein